MVFARIVLVSVALSTTARADLLCFGAKWCQPCREMEPTIERLHQEGYPVRTFDIDARPDLARRYRVNTVPSFVLVNEHGGVVDRIDQATSYNSLTRMLEHYKQAPDRTIVRGQSERSPKESILQAIDRPISLEPVPSDTPRDDSAQSTAMSATVRLRVEDAQGQSFGTGTVIDVHDQEALVLTCGHIFRDSQGKGRIQIDRFDDSGVETTTGTVISYDIDRDIGLVSMKLTRPIQVVKLASLPSQEAQDVFSVGCGHGEPPSVMRGRIKRINKYLGPANITASGKPVDGRSGGGLFNLRGELIGVCSAADPELDEGLYGALSRVHKELDRNGLSFVYQRGMNQPNANALAIDATEISGTVPVGEQPFDSKQTPPDGIAPVAHDVATDAPRAVSATAPESAPGTLTTSPGRSDPGGKGQSLICVLQGEGKEGRAFVIQNPSRVLLEYLSRESQKTH